MNPYESPKAPLDDPQIDAEAWSKADMVGVPTCIISCYSLIGWFVVCIAVALINWLGTPLYVVMDAFEPVFKFLAGVFVVSTIICSIAARFKGYT